MQSRPTFIDLFSGAGGLSVGLEMAGWESLLAVDNWADALQTYQSNSPTHCTWLGDIHDLKEEDLRDLNVMHPTWVVGGPPCQGFSTVGKRFREDPRNNLILEFRRIVEITNPEGFIIENVLGLKDMDFTSWVCELFEQLDYAVSPMVLRAADFGVPQLRRRVVFVGHRWRGHFLGPRPTHDEQTFTTVWNAIGDLPDLRPGESKTEYDREPFTDYQRLMREGSTGLQGHEASNHPGHLVHAISFIPDGGNRRSIPDEFQPRSGFHNSYSRLASYAPAVAVTSNMGKPSATRCIHPFQHRGLSAREGARLQSFPDRFHFKGKMISQRLQIANAVPPMLATVLGRALLDESRWTIDDHAEGRRTEQLALPAIAD